jgi:hypothetical protein
VPQSAMTFCKILFSFVLAMGISLVTQFQE